MVLGVHDLHVQQKKKDGRVGYLVFDVLYIVGQSHRNKLYQYTPGHSLGCIGIQLVQDSYHVVPGGHDQLLFVVSLGLCLVHLLLLGGDSTESSMEGQSQLNRFTAASGQLEACCGL